MNRIILIIAMLSSPSVSVHAQDPDTSMRYSGDMGSDRMESILERTDADLDYSDFAEDLARVRKHPVNLNAASDEQLRKLSFLNELQIANLRAYLQQYGNISSIYELQMIEGFSPETIELMIPFIRLSGPSQHYNFKLSRLMYHGKADLTFRYQQILQQQKGYLPASDSLLLANPNARYLGGQGRLYTRFKYAYSDRLQFGFTAEKDPGETFLNSNDTLKRGFDFYSAHVFYEGPGLVKQVALGDYQVQFGQGLTLWSGLSFSKLLGDVSGKKLGQGIKPSSSANESLFMRGAAVTAGSGKMGVTLFYSSHRVDANLVTPDTLDAEDAYFSSLQESGYHRTASELLDKHAALVESAGGHVTFKTGTLHLGATVYRVMLDAGQRKSQSPSNLFNITSQKSLSAGIDYDYLYKKLNLYGETARSDNGAVATVNGMTFAADPRFVISAIYRNYPRDYNNLFSNSFAESSHPSNEKGLYTGFVASLASKWTLIASIDQYKFGWLKYRVDAPSQGAEYSAQIAWKATRTSEIKLRFRQAHKQLNSTENLYINTLQATDKRDVRLEFSTTPYPYLLLRSRIEYSEFHGPKGTSNGYLVYQDIGFRPEKYKLSLTARFAIFDAPVYDSRIYAYENDVLYAFTTSSYYGVGSRFYLVAAWHLSRHIAMWLKYSSTHYRDRQMISSGLDEIDGNRRSEIKVQLRLSL